MATKIFPQSEIRKCKCGIYFIRDKQHDGSLALCNECWKSYTPKDKLQDIPLLFDSSIIIKQISISDILSKYDIG
jgi:hypothetical protein